MNRALQVSGSGADDAWACAEEDALRSAMLQAVPNIRAFAVSLCGRINQADDIVQETLLKALANLHAFQPGTNMAAWLTTIARNVFLSDYRKRKRERVYNTELGRCVRLNMAPEQHSRLEYSQFMDMLMRLPVYQREALILIGASGFSQEAAAQICGCAVGTVKSRVHRARRRLAAMTNLDETDTFGPDHASLAIVA